MEKPDKSVKTAPTSSSGRNESIKTEPGVKEEFSVFAAGDVYLGKLMKGYIKKHGPEYPFSQLRDTIEKYDIALANLESAISTRGEQIWKKKYLFQISLNEAQSLNSSGLDLVSIANNHTMDFGDVAFLDTLEALDSLSVPYVGGGRDVIEASKPALLTSGQTKIIILAYCGWISSITSAGKDKPGINPLEIDDVVKDIQKYKQPGSIVLVFVHWGKQHIEIPAAGQIQKAHMMIDAGADAILGHHSHCPQSVEVYKEKPIFYSLGNLVFGMCNPDGVHNIAAVLKFEGDKMTAAEILPIHGRYHVSRYSPYFLTGQEAQKVLRHIESISKRFDTKIDFDGEKGVLDLHNG